ncbi:MAG: hypothetical protein ACLFRG_21075 [Desulfococcaceae bacterium]
MGRILLLVFLALFLVLATLRKWKLFFAVTAAALAVALVLLFTAVRSPETEAENPLARVRLAYSPDKRPLVTATAFGEALKSVHGLILSDIRLPADPDPEALPDADALWANGFRLLDRLETAGRSPMGTRTDFGAHLVVATWPDVADALARRGLVQSDGPDGPGGVLTDPAGLVSLARSVTPWASLGIRNMPGAVRLHAPSPRGDAAGRVAALWLAEILSGSENLTADQLDSAMPELQTLYRGMGSVAASSMDLFGQFVKQGSWDYPLAIVDEQAIVAFDRAFPAYRKTLASGIRILRLAEPRLAEHPTAAFTEVGHRFLEAAVFPETAALIWEGHGLRPLTVDIPPPEPARRFGLDQLPMAPPARPDGELTAILTAAFPAP